MHPLRCLIPTKITRKKQITTSRPQIYLSISGAKIMPLFATGLTLADKVLLVAGAPKVVDEKQDWEKIYEADVEARLKKQDELLLGTEGAMLWTVDAQSGKKLNQLKLPAIPVWDGMIAANNKVYICLKNGELICLGNK